MADAAHNPDGFRTLKNELILLRKQKNIKNFVFVVGIQNDKNIPSMLKTLNPLISTIIFAKSKNPKAAEPRYLLNVFNKINKSQKINKRIMPNPKKALSYAKKIAGKNGLVVAAGSIYLAGELL